MRLLASVFILVGGLVSDPVAPTPHNVHVTFGEIGVDGAFVAARIKYYKHDLEDAIARQRGRTSVVLTAGAASDSLFVEYLDAHLLLRNGDERLKARVVGSGEEKEEEMWWYEVLYESQSPVSSLSIENKQLMELFKDQKNILRVEHFTTGKRRSFYFVRRATTATFDAA